MRCLSRVLICKEVPLRWQETFTWKLKRDNENGKSAQRFVNWL